MTEPQDRLPIACREFRVEEVHRRHPHKSSNEKAFGSVIDFVGCSDLLQDPVVDNGYPVSQRHRLNLVVGHKDRRCADVVLEPFNLSARVNPDLGIQIRHRFIKEIDLRLPNHGASEGDALHLSTTEDARFPTQHIGYLQNLRNTLDLRINL